MTVTLYSGGQPLTLDPVSTAAPHPHPTMGVRYGFPWSIDGSRPLAEWFSADYATMWRTQPALRRVVEFLARNLAQLPIHVFRRVSDVDRVRLNDHPLAVTLNQPSATQTRYRFVEAVVSDLCLFDRSYAAVVGDGGAQPVELLWLPSTYCTLDPEQRTLRVYGHAEPLPLDELLWFAGYSPTLHATPPCETLRAVLAEDRAATAYRAELWANAARISGWIERPPAAPEWSDAARDRFRTEWHGRWTSGSGYAGGTPVLEEGMKFHGETQTGQEAQYIEARKLTMVECAAAYQVPPSMVGMTENANYASTKEFRKALYQDTLGPWVELLQSELERQLLPRFADTTDVYVEMSLAAKLAGAFEEQAEVITRAVGAPWMTRNEARAKMNLPHIDDADELVIPLNVLVGGQPSPATPIEPGPQYAAIEPPPPVPLPPAPRRGAKAKRPPTRGEAKAALIAELSAYFARQERQVAPALERGESLPTVFDLDEQDPPLTELLAKHGFSIALAGAAVVLTPAEARAGVFAPKRLQPWLDATAASTARAVNTTTYQQLAVVGVDPRHVYEVARTSRAEGQAESWDTTSYNFGGRDAARAARRTFKTWRVTSGSPRPSHSRLNGETVGVDEEFSNGARFPGDPGLDVSERARCSCVCEYTTEGA